VASNILVKRLAIIFGEPKTEDPEGFLAEYASATKGTEKDILNAAADVIIKQRKFRNWPTVAECLDAIESAKKQVVSKGKMLETIENFDKWFEDKIERMRAAKTRPQMQAIMDEVRPYDAARWIAPHRLGQLAKVMEARCNELFGAEATATLSDASRRMTGEAEA
jgi:hypothetical protein